MVIAQYVDLISFWIEWLPNGMVKLLQLQLGNLKKKKEIIRILGILENYCLTNKKKDKINCCRTFCKYYYEMKRNCNERNKSNSGK